MAIHPSQILFHAGGNALKLYGTPSRRVAPIARRGEDIIETFSRASVGSYIDANGEVKLAESGALRIEMVDLDGDGIRETPVVLLEDTRTNLLLRSEELDNASWTKTRATPTANSTVAPDGLTTADTLVEDATASDTHFATQTVTITADGNVAFSRYLKASTRTIVALQLSDTADADTVTTWFNLSTGALGTTGSVAGTATHVRSLIEALGNSWYRCTIVGAIGGAVTSCKCITYLADADNSIAYSGDGSSGAFVWGAQAEDNVAFPSSYIVTVGSTVARALEQCRFPHHAEPQTSTIYVRFIESGTIIGGGRLFQIGDTSDNLPSARMFANASLYRFQHRNDTTTVTVDGGAGISYGDTVEVAVQLASNGAANLFQSINAAAITESGASGANAFADAWSDQLVNLNSFGGSAIGFNKFIDFAIFAGVHSMADCRKATQQ